MQIPFDIQLNIDDTWNMQHPHFHDDFEILLCLQSTGCFFVEHTLYKLQPGSLLILPDTILHRSFGSNYYRYVLQFPMQTLQALSTTDTRLDSRLTNAPRYVQLDEPTLSRFRASFSRCAMQKNEFGDDLRRQVAFIELLLEIADLPACRGHVASSCSLPEKTGITYDVIKYIQAHLSEPLTLERVASQFFISKYHLCRIFKRDTGFTLLEYIISARIFKARSLLRQGVSLREVECQTAFQSSEYFSRTFKKLSGITPGQYQKKYAQVSKQD